MCNLSEGLVERGRKAGREESKLDDIRNIMESFHITVEEAMKALKIPEASRERYRTLLADS